MPRLNGTPTEIQSYLALLAGTIARVTACTAPLDAARLAQRPEPRAWSALEVLAHLRACSDLWSYSIYAMLAQDNPTLPLLDERKWTKVTRYAALEFRPSFQAFALQRAELLRVLNALPQDAWGRTATIEGRVHSVFSQVRRMALHEAEHCTQLESLCR